MKTKHFRKLLSLVLTLTILLSLMPAALADEFYEELIDEGNGDIV